MISRLCVSVVKVLYDDDHADRVMAITEIETSLWENVRNELVLTSWR